MLTDKEKIGFRPTWAEVDLSNLVFNFQQIKKQLSPRTKVLACIKADAYGHGLLPVAKKLAAGNVDYFGVASIDEAITVRQAGIRTPILVLGMVLPKDIKPLFEYSIVPTVCTAELAQALNAFAGRAQKRVAVHVKVDTGMGRIGVAAAEAADFIGKLRELPFINVEGVFTHLACADTDRKFTLAQLKRFEAIIEGLNRRGVAIPLVHAANSMGIVSYKNSHFNMVRPGLILYGLYPQKKVAIRLRPVMSLKTKVIFVKKLAKGSGVSYGHSYITPRDTTLVTLPIGYGDGYPRNLSNTAPVLIRGKKFTVSGRVCMDQIMVDVGKSGVRVGDEVVLIGRQKGLSVSAEELARLGQTIPYEIVCGIGSRVPRLYVGRSSADVSDLDSAIAEKRASLRYPKEWRLRFADLLLDPQGKARTRDISSSGIGILTSKPMAPSANIEMMIDAPGIAESVYACGKVVWSRRHRLNEYHSGISLDGTDVLGICGISGKGKDHPEAKEEYQQMS